MSLGDLTVYQENVYAGGGARLYYVQGGTSILAGEPVQITALGVQANSAVLPLATNLPTVTTALMIGVAATSATNTTSATGVVWVTPVTSALTYLVNPDTAATWNTQAKYDALVGARVLLKNSVTIGSTPGNGAYTVLAADSSANGCVVVPLDVAKFPGKVAIRFRDGCNYLA